MALERPDPTLASVKLETRQHAMFWKHRTLVDGAECLVISVSTMEVAMSLQWNDKTDYA